MTDACIRPEARPALTHGALSPAAIGGWHRASFFCQGNVDTLHGRQHYHAAHDATEDDMATATKMMHLIPCSNPCCWCHGDGHECYCDARTLDDCQCQCCDDEECDYFGPELVVCQCAGEHILCRWCFEANHGNDCNDCNDEQIEVAS